MPSFPCTLGRKPRSTLFPYTTLFRSSQAGRGPESRGEARRRRAKTKECSDALPRSEEHTSELQSLRHLVCRLFHVRSGESRDLHSFPTRRSSDLAKQAADQKAGEKRAEDEQKQKKAPTLYRDRKSTRLNSSHLGISYAVFSMYARAKAEIYTLSLHDALPI